MIGYKLRGGGRVIGLAGRNKENKQLFLCQCKCGVEFSETKFKIMGNKNKPVRFGCIKCSYIYRAGRLNKNIIGKKFSRLTVLLHYKTKCRTYYYKCLCECGNECIVSGSNLKTNHTQSCGCLRSETSRELLYKLHPYQKGQNNPNWNVNLTDKDRYQKRDEIKLKPLRLLVFNRDNYTCEKCQHKGGELICHHLQGYHWFVPGRFDPNNLATLCKKCHKQFHSLFGNKYNTKEQFNTFLIERKEKCQVQLQV